MKKLTTPVALFFIVPALTWSAAEPTYLESLKKIRGQVGLVREDVRLKRLMDLQWEHSLMEFPTLATMVGDSRYQDRWSDSSLQAVERRRREMRELQKTVASIQVSRLRGVDRLNYELFRYGVDYSVRGQRYPDHLLTMGSMSGIHIDLSNALERSRRNTDQDLRNYVARLKGISERFVQTQGLMREGMKQKILPPKVTLLKAADQLRAQIPEDPMKSPWLEPLFREYPKVDVSTLKAVRDEAVQQYTVSIRPAVLNFLQFFEVEYLPNCRETIAFRDLPEGPSWYEHEVEGYVTTRLSVQEIHRIGLAEVARIRQEMDAIRQKVGFKKDLSEFDRFLREDSQFFFKSKADLLEGYRALAKRIDAEIPKLFGRMPRLPYGVELVPEHIEKSQASGYYRSGSLRAGVAGQFFMNGFDLKSAPKWEMEALTLHEAVPGHHLQISLAQELEGLPNFRLYGMYPDTAFVEGWGLYSESLGFELGLYKDPYSLYGRLNYEMLRSIRLVVDTGMHALGWTRDQALDYFQKNSAVPRKIQENEVDRYISWPGQALAYKIGELKLKALRQRAEQDLGAKFNVREFHDQVLGQGSLPLDVLEREVLNWVTARKKAP